ncbi:cytochrome P450 [Suillus weaverae]|nr:cytochrome P450 [Suillus weaverae]
MARHYSKAYDRRSSIRLRQERFQMLMRPGEDKIRESGLPRPTQSCFKSMATGKTGSSFARYRLENQSSHKLSDEEIAASPFGVGSDTTAVAIMYVVMASACYPKAQEKVQEQLDIVVDKGMCVPEGTIVFGNNRAISRDPGVYPNPDKFDPEGWLNSEGKIRDDLKFPSYGVGRRYGLA